MGDVIEGKRVIRGLGRPGRQGQRKKMAVGGEKALQIGKKSFIINGFCNKL
jgi:hypothetical protein